MNKIEIQTLTTEQMAVEYIKCRNNILYFAFNYVYIPETGGRLKYEASSVNKKLKYVLRSAIKINKVIFMATRQLGKSTVSAIILAWAMIFFPKNRAFILNLNKKASQENLEKIKFIHRNLPEWLIKVSNSQLKYDGDRKTYLEFANLSRIDLFYPSSATSPEELGRSFSCPIIYLDEVSNIRHVAEAYGSAAPAISKAREQAIKNNYPHLLLMSSTPNGVAGEGEFFYKMYSNAIDCDDIFDENGNFIEDYHTVLSNPNKNGFLRIKYHWSEDETKDDNWYARQKQDLNFDTRRINQELDLLFVGGNKCIFSDEYLSNLKPKKPLEIIKLPHVCQLKVYDEFANTDYYIIGIDSAKSITGDFCAVEVFEYSTFKQIGEFFNRIGSISKYIEVLVEIVKYVESKVGDKIILAIENNSIGNQVIEYFENDSKYAKYIYTPEEGRKDYKLGINTNSRSKDVMITCLFDYISDKPDLISSHDFINQLSVIERRGNGTIAAQYNQHDDLFAAAAFCAYVKKLSQLEYDPLILGKSVNSAVNQTAKYVNNIVDYKNIRQDKSAILEYGSLIYRSEDELDNIGKNDLDDILCIF